MRACYNQRYRVRRHDGRSSSYVSLFYALSPLKRLREPCPQISAVKTAYVHLDSLRGCAILGTLTTIGQRSRVTGPGGQCITQIRRIPYQQLSSAQTSPAPPWTLSSQTGGHTAPTKSGHRLIELKASSRARSYRTPPRVAVPTTHMSAAETDHQLSDARSLAKPVPSRVHHLTAEGAQYAQQVTTLERAT